MLEYLKNNSISDCNCKFLFKLKKKGYNKKKGKCIPLAEYHANLNAGTVASGAKTSSTTDPASDVAGKYVPPWMRNKSSTETYSGIPTTLEAAHEFDINLELIPKQPPYTAHLSNVSYEADEESIKAFFKDLKMLAVRFPVDEPNRKKGFGDVEFEDRESLIAALAKKDTLFNGRPIKIRKYWREDDQQQQWRGDFSQRDS